MITQFKDVALDKLDELQFIEKFERKFQDAIQSIYDYYAKYGRLARPCKAKLDVQIVIDSTPSESKPENLEDAGFQISIKKMKMEPPADHAVVVSAVCAKDEEGKPKLFVNVHSDAKEDPRQFHLATADGHGIDPATGEASDKHTEFVPAYV